MALTGRTGTELGSRGAGRTLLATWGLLAVLAACGDGPQPEPPTPAGGGGEAGALATPSAREVVYDREFLFIARGPAPPLALPWFFRSRVQLGAVQREQGVWMLRENAWETLAQESSSGPTTRTPWRILPGRDVRVVVGDGDAVEALLLRNEAGEVETRLVQFLFEWARPDGESVRLFDARTTFPSGPTPGYLVDVSRSWEAPSGRPGDWIFLTAGPGVQVFFEEAPPVPLGGSPLATYRGWIRSGNEVEQWTDLTVRWTDQRPFERARRDVPYGWAVTSGDDFIAAELTAVATHLTTGEADGPILPVSGLFSVSGSLRIADQDLAVTGVVRHVQR